MQFLNKEVPAISIDSHKITDQQPFLAIFLVIHHFFN
jgi:hypothetical protein